MKVSPKPSRMERQVRSQARGLHFVSLALLAACMTMTALFGWGFGRTLIEKITFAGGLAAIDLAGALLMKSNGTWSAHREYGALFWGGCGAAICAAITFLGILGFQSEARESQVASRERAVQVADDVLAYAKTTVTDAVSQQAKGKSANPALISAGIETLGKAAKDQIGMLQSGELVVSADGAGKTLSRVTGLTEAQARSWTVTVLSAAFLAIQYVLLYLYGFMRQRIEPVVAALAASGHHVDSGDNVASKFGKPAKFANSPKFDEARREVVRLIITGNPFPTNKEFARRWNVSSTTACHWLQALRDEGHDVPMPQRGGRRARKPAVHLNGNGAVVGNA